MSALALSISPDSVLRQQTLVDTVERLAKDRRDDLVEILREQLHDAIRGTATSLDVDVTALLFAAAVADRDHLASLVEAFGIRQHNVELHEQTTGHDQCCGYHCVCSSGGRCSGCATAPHAVLDDVVRDLNAFLASTVGEGNARTMAGAA